MWYAVVSTTERCVVTRRRVPHNDEGAEWDFASKQWEDGIKPSEVGVIINHCLSSIIYRNYKEGVSPTNIEQ